MDSDGDISAIAMPIESTGPALGLFQDARFDDILLPIPPGSQLVLFTDGVNEALDADDQEFGCARVATMLTGFRGRTAAEQAAALLEAVRTHRGARQAQDDVTVMVILAH